MSVKVNFKTEGLMTGIADLGRKMPKAVARALKRTSTTVRADLARLISADTGLAPTKVKLGVSVHDPTCLGRHG